MPEEGKLDRILTVDVGVVVAREAVDHPWQDHIWRPIEVFLNAPKVASWRELRRGDGFVHYHAATIPMELHRKEAAGYRETLQLERPGIYVVLRSDDHDDVTDVDDDNGPWPVSVHMVTASPFDVEAYGDSGDEIIDVVPMPAELIALVSEFVATHYVEEPFRKRRQKRHHREEDYHFGQEPVAELRERMKRAGRDDPTLQVLKEQQQRRINHRAKPKEGRDE